MRLLRTVVPAALVVLLAACGAGGGGLSSSVPPPGGPGGSALAGALDGRTFLSTRLAGYTLAQGTRIRLAFDGSRLGASAGCNQLAGDYEVRDGVLEVGVFAMTEMACDEPRMAQDTWLEGLLDGARIALDGDTLTLDANGVTIELRDEEAVDPDRPLAGTGWTLRGIVDGGAVSSVPAGVTATIRFADGSVEFENGCNTGGGPATIVGPTVTFGPLATTKKACLEAGGRVEAAFMAVVHDTATWAIDGGSLTIVNGGKGLVFGAG